LIWNFGNGFSDTTTEKNKEYAIYYPEAGDYEVSLRLTNYTGGSATANKSINIATTDLSVSFTADIDPSDPNLVMLKNTSVGEYDSFKWFFRDKEIENEVEYTAYFPFAGSYDIELKVFKSSESFSLEQTVTILQDDPDYIQNLTLVWSDEFDGSSVNQDYWNFDTGATGWGNNELQEYTNGANAEVTGGKLIITALKVNDNMQTGSYTSSRLNSKVKKEFRYGRMEFRAKLPSGRGIWPALWMLGSNFSSAGWPACGELDIMEYVGYQPNTVYSTVHCPAGYGATGNGSSMTLATCEEEFHNYGLIWTEKKMIFYVDTPDNVIHTYAPAVKTPENWPFDQPAFFILNIAVGGNWGGAQGIDNSIFPQTMEVDYVRVYQEAK
jgi:beta-glucanase (GH16 family)